MSGRFLLIAAAVLLWALPAAAHEARPALLQLSEAGPGHYEVLWKRPQRGELTLSLRIGWPAGCRELVPPAAQLLPGALVERGLVACERDLAGQRITVAGLAGTTTDVLVRIEFGDGRVQTSLVGPAEPWLEIRGPRPALAVAGDYLGMGIEHILLGIDHLLFVLALLLIVGGGWMLVKTITAFTLAHSVTLAMATLGFVHVPQAPVEAVIALSLVFLASELVRQRRGEVGLTVRHPWLVACCFGLLHGFGFAGALAEVGLPERDIPLALLAFNLGVEIGQLLFVASVLAHLSIGRSLLATTPRWLQAAPPYAIGSLAAFWLIERVAAFG